MKLFLDNTGLHSVGRCLDGEAKGEPDVAGLLQFATQLVFSDELFYTAFDKTAVAVRSRNVSEQVSELGVTSDLLRLSRFDGTGYELYDRAVLAAGQRVAVDLFPFSDTTTNSELIATSAPDLSPTEQQHYDNLHRAIKSGDERLRSELSAEGNDEQLIASGARLIAISDNLWIRASQLAQDESWDTASTAKLVVMMRSYLNQELAALLSRTESVGVDYSPSVARARIIEVQDAYVLRKLPEIIGHAAHELGRIKLEAPPVALALALRAKGDPKGVIAEALIAREKATELRLHLRDIVDTARKATSGQREDLKSDVKIHRLRNAIRELASLLQQDLGITPRGGVLDAFEGLALGPVPIPTPAKVVEWIKWKRKLPRITILSEFAKTLANPTRDTLALRKLSAACQHNMKTG
jgi:hypothetical protein